MNRPQVSVLMAVRNEQSFLPAALASLQAQTLRDWELVAVDDGSRDRTPDILAAAAARDRRIRVLRRPPRGLVAALNTGLAHCRAPLVARFDGDDLCHPQRLELQARFMRLRPELTVLGCGVRHVPRWRITEGMSHYESWQNSLRDHEEILRDLYVESPFAHPSVMMRRNPVRALGGYRALPWAEDYDLWLRLAREGARFARLPQVLLNWRDRPRRLTRTAATCTAQAFRACKLHHLRQGPLAGCQAVTLWGAGLEGKAWQRELARQTIRVAAWLEVDARKIGQRIHDAPVLSLDRLPEAPRPILVTIGAKGARFQARAHARALGLVEGADFLCVT